MPRFWTAAFAAIAFFVGDIAEARTAKAPVRVVLTELKAENIVEDCGICTGRDETYLISIAYSGVFGDPKSIDVSVNRSAAMSFVAGQTRRNRFGDLVFSQSPDEPTAITKPIPFPTVEEGVPGVFGFLFILAEANPGFDRDFIVKEARTIVRRTVEPRLMRLVGERSLSLDEYDEVVPTLFEIGDLLVSEVKTELGRSLAAVVNGALNPDLIALEVYVLSGSAAGDEEVEEIMRSADDTDLVTIFSREEIGKRLFSNGPLTYNFNEQRGLVRARGRYKATFEMMALE